MPSQWRIHAETGDDRTVFRFTTLMSLDEANVTAMHESVNYLVDHVQPHDLWFDFGNVAFVSSVSLGILLSLRKKLLARGASLTVYNLRPQVYDVFKVTHLLQLFHVPDNDGETQLRKLAYLKWEAAGKPAEDGIRFWLEAERELLDQAAAPISS